MHGGQPCLDLGLCAPPALCHGVAWPQEPPCTQLGSSAPFQPSACLCQPSAHAHTCIPVLAHAHVPVYTPCTLTPVNTLPLAPLPREQPQLLLGGLRACHPELVTPEGR